MSGTVDPPVLPAVEIEPHVPARASVIWLHGLGADGHDFESIVPALGLSPEFGVRFVFPHAPQRCVTINMGLLMPAWFDIRGLDFAEDIDTRGIHESSAQVVALIAREVERGVPIERIVLAGFSQGGTIALHVALSASQRIAGAIGLSTYLIDAEPLAREWTEVARDLPVFLGHGSHDTLVPPELGQRTHETLDRLGCSTTWKTYPIEHHVAPQEIADLGIWLRERFGTEVV